jgi:microcystin-dependent protein
MANPFLSEIRSVSFGFAPKGWALCNGQLLPIDQNQALFSLLGTTYGGDGRVNFALPNLQGRVAIHMGNGLSRGAQAGEEAHPLLNSEMLAHTHPANCSSATGGSQNPSGQVWAVGSSNLTAEYRSAPSNSVMNNGAIGPTGGNQAHENRQPFLVLNYIIALQGIFPSRIRESGGIQVPSPASASAGHCLAWRDPPTVCTSLHWANRMDRSSRRLPLQDCQGASVLAGWQSIRSRARPIWKSQI